MTIKMKIYKQGKKIGNYLSQNGWEKVDSSEFKEIYTINTMNEEVEVRIPLARYDLYTYKLNEAIETIAKVHKKRYYEILNEMDIYVDIDIEEIIGLINKIQDFNKLDWNRLTLYANKKDKYEGTNTLIIEQLNIYKKTGMNNADIINYIYNKGV